MRIGIKKIIITAHQWEPYYKYEFRRAGRLARELSIAIEPFHDNEDPRFAVNKALDQEILCFVWKKRRSEKSTN